MKKFLLVAVLIAVVCVSLFAADLSGTKWLWINPFDEFRVYELVFLDDSAYTFTIYEPDGEIHQDAFEGTYAVYNDNYIIFDEDVDDYAVLFGGKMITGINEDSGMAVIYIKQPDF